MLRLAMAEGAPLGCQGLFLGVGHVATRLRRAHLGLRVDTVRFASDGEKMKGVMVLTFPSSADAGKLGTPNKQPPRVKEAKKSSTRFISTDTHIHATALFPAQHGNPPPRRWSHSTLIIRCAWHAVCAHTRIPTCWIREVVFGYYWIDLIATALLLDYYLGCRKNPPTTVCICRASTASPALHPPR